jgi:hypothetical protein
MAACRLAALPHVTAAERLDCSQENKEVAPLEDTSTKRHERDQIYGVAATSMTSVTLYPHLAEIHQYTGNSDFGLM